MHDKTALEMMNRCKQEIESLRKQIAYLEPQAEAYDAIRQILGLTKRNNSSVGMGEDIGWILHKEIERIEAQIKDDEAAKASILRTEIKEANAINAAKAGGNIVYKD